MAVNELQIDLVCSGQDGSAAGAALSTVTVTGLVKSIHVAREAGGENTAMPDTNTVLVTAEGPPDVTLLNVRGEIGDEDYHPKGPAHYTDGRPILYEGVVMGDDIALSGHKIKVEVNNANNGDEVTVRVRYSS